jgi:hypothetical protein
MHIRDTGVQHALEVHTQALLEVFRKAALIVNIQLALSTSGRQHF